MFSVVIPLYNKAHTIVNTLQTVINQTFSEFEVIIVNDGSTDNGVEIINEFIVDPRIRIINQENYGVSVARNKGVKESNFEYIAFLDGDDEWMPTYLELMYKAVMQYPTAGMYCSAGLIRHTNKTESLRMCMKYKGCIKQIDFFQNPGVYLHTSATIVSKTFFNQTSGFPVGMKRNQDFALFFNIALISDVIYCGIPLSIYVGGVPYQATQTSTDKVISHITNRFNYVHNIWLSTNKNKKTYLIYTRYELRHLVISLIREMDYKSIDYIASNLQNSAQNLLHSFEWFTYRNRKLKYMSILYILFTKIIWRSNRFPIVRGK